jgi:ubiquinone/menaquinone biosynthesis C-methylase UbiE
VPAARRLPYRPRVVYQHPLAYLLGLEGLALLRSWAGDDGHDERFVRARLAEVRRLLDDPGLAAHPGVHVGTGATDDAYEQWSESYDEPGNPLFDLDEPFLDEVLDTLPPGPALDAACGTGRLAARLRDRGHRVVGVDTSSGMLRQARRRLPHVDLRIGDLRQLPVSDGSVDLVVTGLALTHVPDLAPVFAEFARVLRRGGRLVVSDVHPDLVLLGSVVTAVGPDGRPRLAETHRHTTGDVLRASLAAGFRVRRFDERPRNQTPPASPEEQSTGIGPWSSWPWSLLGVVPEAARSAWAGPAVVLWHLQR